MIISPRMPARVEATALSLGGNMVVPNKRPSMQWRQFVVWRGA